uniref:uncharacterized protein n=1 Tax=Myxine glutinosa TaxID=7769 RepID=UPI00358E545C
MWTPHTALLLCAVMSLLVHWFMWMLSALLHTEKFYDMTGITMMMVLSHLTWYWGGMADMRRCVQNVLVTMWGVRLGAFLLRRVIIDGEDRRFDKMRNNLLLFFIYWTLQAMWIILTTLPTLLLNTNNAEPPVGLRDYLGWIIWTIGFGIESAADQQKYMFRRNPTNRNKFIQTGLWAYSRHPNYVGEILIWIGLALPPSTVLVGAQHLSLLSPIAVWFLLRYVSGVTPLELGAAQRWGHNPAYKRYVANTPVLFFFLNY